MVTTYGTVPSHSEEIKVSFPAEHVMLLTLNRPKKLNAVGPQMRAEIGTVLNWFEDEPSLWVVIVTGEGRAFCAGADLSAWNETYKDGNSNESQTIASSLHGFASISRRQTSNKPIIAAVNGPAYGGGVELILNCDLVVASDQAVFALPEVKRGVVAAEGAIPRLAAVAGHQLASELLLLGNTVSAIEARDRFRFVNRVVPASAVLETALSLAAIVTENSPDSVQSSKRGLIFSQQLPVEEAVRAHALGDVGRRVYRGENIKEGLAAFAEKRKPRWKNPARL